MVKVRCVLGYYDTKLARSVAVGEEFEVDEARAKQLIKAKVAETVAVDKEVKTRSRKKNE
ncbi:MAG: hypothetical protein IJV71_05545 [Lachnospiraceae bacterium]|nr:hypothetical protein [Lachnospiraceae bacterium]